MEDQIRKILKPLKSLEPSKEFLLSSKSLILSTPQEFAPESSPSRFFEGLRFGIALTMAAFLFIVALGSVSYFGASSSGSVASSLNQTTVSEEANSASREFMVQIREANYFNDSAARVASALDEISAGAEESEVE